TNVTNLDIDSGTVTYIGTNSTIQDFGSVDYYNLTINGGGVTFSLGSLLSVAGDFNLTAGTFNQSTFAMNVAGNFSISNGATFTKSSNSSALTMDGTGNLSDANGTLQDLGMVVIDGFNKTRTLT